MCVGMWMGTLPRGWIARHYGRRASFFVGTGFGVLTGLIACAAVLTASFLLFCIGALFTGFYASVASVLPLRRCRHRERRVPAEGDLLGDGRRHLCRHRRARSS